MTATTLDGGASRTAERRMHTSRRTYQWPLGIATLVAGCGLALQALGYYLGWIQAKVSLFGLRFDATDVDLWTYFIGLVIISGSYIPAVCARDCSPRQRLGGCLLYAQTMYLSWMLLNPFIGAHFDESLQTTTLLNLLKGEQFFTPNPGLPVSPYFPGIELVSAPIYWATGLPIMAVQVITVMLARTVMIVALYGIYRRLLHSDRGAAIGIVLYMGAAQFYFFDAQYNYDTLAVALAPLVLLLTIRLYDSAAGGTRRSRWTDYLWPLLAMACLGVTHHLGSSITVMALFAWAVLHALEGRWWAVRRIATVAIFGLVWLIAWFSMSRDLLKVYLLPLFTNAQDQLSSLLAGQGGGRALFSNNNSAAFVPAWERYWMLAACVIWSLLLVVPAWQILRGRLLSTSRARFLPWVVGCAFPPLLLARFSPNAGEISERSTGYVMMAVALLIAAGLTRQRSAAANTAAHAPAPSALRRRLHGGVAVVIGVILTIGGVLLGAGATWEHRTGPFLGSGQFRAVDAKVISVAQWFQRYAPAGSRFGADNTFGRVLPTYAPVDAVTYLSGSENLAAVFLDDAIAPAHIATLKTGKVDFLVVDTRLAQRQSVNGTYYEISSVYPKPQDRVSWRAVDKFESAPGFVKVVQDGPIQVYDVRSLRKEPATFADRGANTLPVADTADASRRLRWATLLMASLLVATMAVRRINPARAFPGVSNTAAPAMAVGIAALMGLSVIGFWVGYAPILGAVVLGGATAAACWSIVRLSPGRWQSPSWLRVVGALCVLVFGAAVWLAFAGAYQGFIDPITTLPAPLSGPGTGGS